MLEVKEAETVAKPDADQQDVKCMKKVDYIPPKEEKTPIGHEIAFGILVTVLVLTPAIWMTLWKLRQPPAELSEFDADAGSDGGEEYEGNQMEALQNLDMFEDTKLALTQSNDGQNLGLQYSPRQGSKSSANLKNSPRGGSKSSAAVAMAPPSAIQDANGVENGAEDDALTEVHDPRGGSVPVVSPEK